MPLSSFRNRCPAGSDRAGECLDGSSQKLDVLDVDLLSEAVTESTLEHRQLGRGPFHGELERRKLGDLYLDGGFYNRDLQSRGTFAPGAVLIGFILEAREAGCLNGLRFGRQDLVLFPEGAEMDYLQPAETRWAAIQVPASLLVEAGVDPDALERVSVYAGTRPVNAALAKLLRNLLDTQTGGRCSPVGGNCEPTATIHALLELIPRVLEPMDEPTSMRRPSLQTRIALVRRFERCLSYADPFNTRISELASSLGVSQRTLEYIFRAHTGMSPKRYLAVMRLNQIQRELLTATPESTTVAEIARRNGIGHLGRFSAEYCRQFGELPSQTLNRLRYEDTPDLGHMNGSGPL